MRLNRFFIPPLLLLAALTLLAAGEKSGEKELLDNLDLFTDVVTMINEDYYQDMKPGELMIGAIEGMMASLDRYSYIKTGPEAGGAGLGLELAIVNNLLTVVSAVEGGPAAKAGIIHGDKIVQIDEELISNITLDDVHRMLRGEEGSEVKLTLYREGAKGTKDLTVERREVATPGLVESVVYDDTVGYMRLASVPAGSGREFSRELDSLLKQGVTGLVLDLRDNPGGEIADSAGIAGRLVGNGEKVVSVESRIESEKKDFSAPSAPPPDISIAVLVNGGTAGEAEVIAGALKGSARALLIGSKTFGKGAVQKDIPLDDDLMLHLTVGRYAVGDAAAFDGEGIEPDVEVPIGLEEEAVLQRLREGAEVDEKEKPADAQMERAVDLLKGIGILGGQGGA